MTHILPAHGDPNIGSHTSISSALEMEQAQASNSASPPPPSAHPREADQASSSTNGRKRKKLNVDGDESPAMSEPRRLRRSHEACARCRSKKIKCDSKHPKCTACVTAGVQCNQEDRHRKTLTPRGHVEKIERQILQCQALLRRHIPNFNLNDLDNILAREGIEVDPSPQEYAEAFQFAPSDSPLRSRQDAPHSPPRAYYHPHMLPGFPPMTLPPGYPPPPPGHPYPPMAIHGPPMFPPHVAPYHPQHIHPAPLRPDIDIKGQDPQMLDMSSTKALAKNFGVAPQIMNDLKLNAPSPGLERLENEDLAVRSTDSTQAGRTRELFETAPPRDTTNWISVGMQHVSYIFQPNTPMRAVTIWLPKDRAMTKRIVDIYFTRLDVHRPTFIRRDFETTLDRLYDEVPVQHDPGYVCSLYLVLALGTMCDLNRALSETSASSSNLKKLHPPGWPEHVEFFERALAIKPDLRVTLSSLQALILLHWYLYTERQGRSLWRLVGNLVRVAIELGLHHDPFQQGQTFSEEEARLRIRLWATVMIHDRGTSILLGRPLGISPPDSNTPRPTRTKNAQGFEFSEHFLLSAPVVEIQADIVNSLYSPTRQGQEAIMRNTTRIIKSMIEFRKQLPESYKYYFGGTENWTKEERAKLVKGITEDQGLTLLKIGIARILLLRALFSSSELNYNQRRRALADAIVASHNVIVVHNHLLQFPDIAFFVSPIPIHISAMVILYGQMSKDTRLSRETAIQDIWTALDMLPRFRWRWERMDMNAGHPMIEMLAEKVLSINLREVNINNAGPSFLIPEEDWEAGSPQGNLSPSSNGMQLTSPTHTHSPFGGQLQYGTTSTTDGAGRLVNVPSHLFWPMDPQNPVGIPLEQMRQQSSHPVVYYPQPIGTIGCQASHYAYVLEEKDPRVAKADVEPLMDAMAIWPGFRDGHDNHGPAASTRRE